MWPQPGHRLFPYTTLFRSGTLGEAAAADRQFVRFHPQLFLAGKPAVATPVHVDASALEYGGDAHLLALERSEEHTSELQSPDHLVCRLLLEKKNSYTILRH